MLEKNKKLMNKKIYIDDTAKIIIVLLAICYFSLMMIQSAAGVNGQKFFFRQAFFIILGFGGMKVLQKIKLKWIWRMTSLLYTGSILLIFLLLTPLGVAVNGATRWLNVAGIQFQVAEVVKIAVIFFVSYMINTYPTQRKNPFLTLYIWGIGGIPAVLLLLISNDLSSSLVILGITFLMSFVYTETPKLHFAMFVLVLTVVIAFVVYVSKHMPDPKETEDTNFRLMRIAAWIEPEMYYEGAGFQTIQAKKAIISGGIIGQGLGRSLQKWGKIPEAHTDFIFSIICEELGAIGAGVLITMYSYLLYQIIKISIRAKGLFESAIVSGVFFHLSIQMLFNICVCLGLLPNTGLPFPLVSYGGTSVALVLMEIGMILKIQRRSMVSKNRREEGV